VLIFVLRHLPTQESVSPAFLIWRFDGDFLALHHLRKQVDWVTFVHVSSTCDGQVKHSWPMAEFFAIYGCLLPFSIQKELNLGLDVQNTFPNFCLPGVLLFHPPGIFFSFLRSII